MFLKLICLLKIIRYLQKMSKLLNKSQMKRNSFVKNNLKIEK